MLHKHRWMLAPLMMAAIALSGCAELPPAASAKVDPFKVEPISGTELNRLTLEAKAVERLGITTEQVAALPSVGRQGPRTSVPYGAVFYDPKGTTWVYTNSEPLVFVRHPITVEHIKGDLAVLREGPPVGTSVVTTGLAELTGVEFGVGK